jgi:hypothetical protein
LGYYLGGYICASGKDLSLGISSRILMLGFVFELVPEIYPLFTFYALAKATV